MPVEIAREPGYELTEEKLGAAAAERLGRAFPGYSWRVHINTMPTGGVMDIECLELESAIHRPFGVTLKMETVYGDPTLFEVVKAGGLILEFAELPFRREPGDPVPSEGFWRNYFNYHAHMQTGLKG